MVKELDARLFSARLRDLLTSADQARNAGCIECTRCRACSQSTFCQDSERLVRCHYCVRCAGCLESSHCRDSRNLVSCNHCIDCEGCLRSAYLVRSVGCSDCTYCFGCVGLRGADFHILNEPYERADYFAAVRRLERELGIGR